MEHDHNQAAEHTARAPSGERKDWQRELRQARRSLHRSIAFAGFALTLAVAMILKLTATLMNSLEMPPSQEHVLSSGSKHLIDVVLVDGPTVDDRYLDDMLRPLLMVMEKYRTGYPSHLRLLVMREGMPVGWKTTDTTLAAFAPEWDAFVVDQARVINDRWRKNFKDQKSHLAFLMGHEGYHRIQWLRGELEARLKNPNSTPAYAKDPIEQEAFREGIDVANAMQPGDSQTLMISEEMGLVVSPLINPYRELRDLQVVDVADVHLTRAWTLNGTWMRFRSMLGAIKQ